MIALVTIRLSQADVVTGKITSMVKVRPAMLEEEITQMCQGLMRRDAEPDVSRRVTDKKNKTVALTERIIIYNCIQYLGDGPVLERGLRPVSVLLNI